jgi:hypothetical protein
LESWLKCKKMGKNEKKKLCYMCSQAATSREHVPPACLFPEKKDIKTSIFRNNLITVPSCDLQNSKKSKDDEFLMACLAGIVGNNVIGFFHNMTKVKRALERKDDDFIHVLMKDPKHEAVKNEQGNMLPVLVGRPHIERLRSCFYILLMDCIIINSVKPLLENVILSWTFSLTIMKRQKNLSCYAGSVLKWSRINQDQKVQIRKFSGMSLLNRNTFAALYPKYEDSMPGI